MGYQKWIVESAALASCYAKRLGYNWDFFKSAYGDDFEAPASISQSTGTTSQSTGTTRVKPVPLHHSSPHTAHPSNHARIRRTILEGSSTLH